MSDNRNHFKAVVVKTFVLMCYFHKCVLFVLLCYFEKNVFYFLNQCS